MLKNNYFGETLGVSEINGCPKTKGVRKHRVITVREVYERVVVCLGSVVSHVCAVNLFDGNTALHSAIEAADSVAIVEALVDADSAVINIQNDAGFSPIHVACLHGRKKTLRHLLVRSHVFHIN